MCEKCHQRELELFPEFESLINEYGDELYPEMEFRLSAEVGASNNSAYIKWIQSSLNKILKLNLAVDGISGQYTKSAIRSFQSRYGLTADGIVGPVTEGALIKAGAGFPPGAGIVTPPSPYNPPPSSGSPVSGSLRGNLVSIALQEWNRWSQGSTKESSSSMQAVLKDYWITGTGSDYGYVNNFAWSSAFISWVVKKAGGGTNFRYSGAHTTYTYFAKQNRLQNNSNPFKAYRINEKKPEPGDIIVKNYSGSFTYDNLQPDKSGTHGDIVVKVNSGSIEVIGGNLSDSVSKNTYYLTSGGYLNSTAHFAIIKIETPAFSREFEFPETNRYNSNFFPTSFEFENPSITKDDLKDMQIKLNKYIGFHIAEDGIWGDNTKKALGIFQKKYGLPLTELPNKDTFNYLKKIDLYDENPKLMFEVGYFDVNTSKASDTIIDKSFLIADNLTRMGVNPGIRGLMVLGFTDASGSETNNKQLGYSRALEVERVLRCAFNRFKPDSGKPKNLPIEIYSGGEDYASTKKASMSRNVKVIVVYKNSQTYYTEQRKGIWRNVFSRCSMSI